MTREKLRAWLLEHGHKCTVSTRHATLVSVANDVERHLRSQQAFELEKALAWSPRWHGRRIDDLLERPDFGREKPDLDIPMIGSFSYGFLIHVPTASVHEAWSSAHDHGEGPQHPQENARSSGGRGGRRLFSSKLKALWALRYEMELEAAEGLLRIDRQIQLAKTNLKNEPA
jgi:hypothetical protein